MDGMHFGPVVGMNHRAMRYLHRKNRHAELAMLKKRESAKDCWTNTKLDIEALYCSLMMLDSWEKERVKL
jgi:hypothetical protein